MALSPSSISFVSSGGTQTVLIGGDIDVWSVVGSSVPSWLAFSPVTGTTGRETVCTCAANSSLERRSARVTFQMTGDGDWEEFLDVEQDAGDGSFALQYEGEFPDIRGNVWRCEIMRAAYTGDSSELEFPADSPLAIEWPGTNFEDAVWGSSATLRIVSPGDRTYINLYTTEPGAIRLDVYRNGSLYWSGTLDTEFYEEPYERLQNYEVELTFTDFGILDRLSHGLGGGLVSLTDILTAAVTRSRISHGTTEVAAGEELDFEPHCGLRWHAERESDSNIFVRAMRVRGDNFTDEEGEECTLREAVEGILQPLGLKMTQRGGMVLVFDPAGLREDVPVRPVTWSGDSQTLGVDRVYNGVTVTFSPYASEGTGLPEMEYLSPYKVAWYDLTNDNSGRYNGGQECYTYYPDYSQYGTGQADYTNLDFTIFLGEGGGAEVSPVSYLSFFHILPVYGNAEERTGVAYSFVAGHSALDGGSVRRHLRTALRSGPSVRVLRTERVYLPPVADADEREGWLLRLVQDILLDCRYNPFSGATSYNDTSNQSALTSNSAFVFARASVRLYAEEDGTTPAYHYDNTAVATGEGEQSMKFGTWVSGQDDGWSVWLEYYNPDDLGDNGGGAGGWKSNRHCVGKPDGGGGRNSHSQVNAMMRNADDGEYIPYPPAGGWLEVAVSDGVCAYQNGGSAYPGDTDRWTDRGIYDTLRWWLYGSPEVSVVRNDLMMDEADLDDVEYRGTLDEAAQDDLTIDTICGTCEDAPPTARGLLYDTWGNRAETLYRDGVTDRPERLLIGQLYGQYAARKTVLTGEAEIPEALLLTEDNQSGKTFILTADSEDIRMGVSDIEIRELGDDTYIPES